MIFKSYVKILLFLKLVKLIGNKEREVFLFLFIVLENISVGMFEYCIF